MSRKAKGKLIIIGGHEGIVTLLNVKLHILGEGNSFNLASRRPIVPGKDRVFTM